MTPIKEVEQLHRILIDKFGGLHGIRDNAALESALIRPFQTFDGKDLYPSVLEKAASLIESILIYHPFIDGNKRIGYTLLRFFLIQNGIDIDCFRHSGDGVAIRQSLGIPRSVPVIGTVGRLNEIKRQDVLIRAFARVRQTRRSPDGRRRAATGPIKYIGESAWPRRLGPLRRVSRTDCSILSRDDLFCLDEPIRGDAASGAGSVGRWRTRNRLARRRLAGSDRRREHRFVVCAR